MTNRTIICALGALTLLSGCTTIGIGAAGHIVRQTPLGQYFTETTNLTQNSYAAADYLAHQLQSQYVDLDETITIARLTNSASPDIPVQFDYIIAEAIGERFKQLGYGVDLSTVSVNETSSNIKGKASLALVGHYRREKGYYRMSVQVVGIKDNAHVAAFNYNIPRSWNIDQLVRPEKPAVETPETTAP